MFLGFLKNATNKLICFFRESVTTMRWILSNSILSKYVINRKIKIYNNYLIKIIYASQNSFDDCMLINPKDKLIGFKTRVTKFIIMTFFRIKYRNIFQLRTRDKTPIATITFPIYRSELSVNFFQKNKTLDNDDTKYSVRVGLGFYAQLRRERNDSYILITWNGVTSAINDGNKTDLRTIETNLWTARNNDNVGTTV